MDREGDSYDLLAELLAAGSRYVIRLAHDRRLAMAVELARSSNFAPGSTPSLKVHVVTVMERDCPEGDEPIAWYLVTNKELQLERVVGSGLVMDVFDGREERRDSRAHLARYQEQRQRQR
jgi:hypothetical protein